MNALETRNRRKMDGAARYAAADRSDPFTYARCMAHIANGIANFNDKGEDAFYDADPFQEERLLPDGRPYHVTVYRNVRRP